MRFLVAIMLVATSLHAEPAKVKQATGSIIRTKGQIQTGRNSRIELEMPHSAIVRIGSNAALSFSSDARRLTLTSGTMLLIIPERIGSISIEAGSVVVTMRQGSLEMFNVSGRVKVIALDGRLVVAIAADPRDRRTLRYGQMLDVPVAAKQLPEATTINLDKLLSTSLLVGMGKVHDRIGVNALKQKPRPPSLLNSPPLVRAIRASGAAMTTLGIERRQAAIASAQALAAEQAALASQRTAEQQAARAAVQAAAAALTEKAAAAEQRQQEAERIRQDNDRRRFRDLIDRIPPGQQPGGPPGQQP